MGGLTVSLRFPPSGFTDRTAPRGGTGYAAWLRRALGWVIDFFLVSMINYVLGILFGLFIAPLARHAFAYYVLLAMLSCTWLVYATLCIAKLQGQTPGMRMAQVRCYPAGGRKRISMPQSLTRSLTAEFLVWLPLYFSWKIPPLALIPIAAFLLPTIDSRRQTPWDFLAATEVLDDRW